MHFIQKSVSGQSRKDSCKRSLIQGQETLGNPGIANPRQVTGGKCSKDQWHPSASSSMLEEEGERVEMQQQAEILRSYRNPASNHKAPEREALSKINS